MLTIEQWEALWKIGFDHSFKMNKKGRWGKGNSMAKWQPGFDFSSHVSAGVVSTSGGMRESFTDLYGARGDVDLSVICDEAESG